MKQNVPEVTVSPVLRWLSMKLFHIYMHTTQAFIFPRGGSNKVSERSFAHFVRTLLQIRLASTGWRFLGQLLLIYVSPIWHCTIPDSIESKEYIVNEVFNTKGDKSISSDISYIYRSRDHLEQVITTLTVKLFYTKSFMAKHFVFQQHRNINFPVMRMVAYVVFVQFHYD